MRSKLIPIALPLPEIDDANFGPAMAALNDRKQRFVIAILELGGGPDKYAQCAIRAGYDKNAYATDSGFSQAVHRLVHDEAIQKALIEESKRRLQAGAVMAVSILLEIAGNEMTGTKERLRAVEMILNRTGLPSQTEQKVTVEHKMSDRELEIGIRNLADKLGVDAATLLPKPVIDGEFVEIPAATPTLDDAEHSTAGLEDIL